MSSSKAYRHIPKIAPHEGVRSMSETTIPAVAFAAKSTTDVKGSIPGQLKDCRELARKNGLEIVAEFQDEAASAYSGDRGPGLASALAECEHQVAEHGSCALLVQHSDRLARGDGKQAKHLVEYALWALRTGVTIHSKQDPEMFSEGELGILMSTIGGMRNNQDSKRKGMAVKDGQHRRATRGLQNGGPPPYGYQWHRWIENNEPRCELAIHEPEAVIVRRIYAEYIAGRGQRPIARDLNADGIPAQRSGSWHPGTIAR